MKGATAEPWARTSSDPTSASATMMGSNQNFLRSFRKSKNSFINSNIQTSSRKAVKNVLQSLDLELSELMPHVLNLSRLARDSIGLHLCVEFTIHRIISEQNHKESQWRHDPI